jgi:THO complex subunit 1
MAVPDAPHAPQNNTAARLEELLQRARTVKRSTSIEPPLQVAELVPETEPLFSDINGEKDTLATAVESAAKGVFYANIVGKPCLLQISTNICRDQRRSMSQSL